MSGHVLSPNPEDLANPSKDEESQRLQRILFKSEAAWAMRLGLPGWPDSEC